MRMVTAAPALALSLLALWACGGNTTGASPQGDGGVTEGGSSSASSSGTSSSSSGSSSGGGSSGGTSSGGTSSGGTSGGTSSGGTSSGGTSSGREVPLAQRTGDSDCSTTPPPANDCMGRSPVAGGCAIDSDCTTGKNGRCLLSGPSGCKCTYDTCQHDTDCGAGMACACHNPFISTPGNTCVVANCRTGTDCGPGGYCALSQSGCTTISYYCHTPRDQCVNDSDCDTLPGPAGCQYSTASGYWVCTTFPSCG